MTSQEKLEELARRFGTPLYVYDLNSVSERCNELASAMPFAERVLYAVKANPLPSIVGHLARLGLGAEVSSAGELALALAAGVSPERILYTGPCKTSLELRGAAETGVTWFSMEGPADWRRVVFALKESQCSASALVRVNVRASARAGLSMVGSGTQFGILEEHLPEAVTALDNGPLRVAGIHLYEGTQIRDSAMADVVQRTFEASARIAETLHIREPVLNLGGGFPWPFASFGVRPRLASLVDCGAKPITAGTTIWFESGRYLVASSGTLIATVMEKKVGRDGATQLLLDGGINVLSGMSGLGRVLPPELSATVLGRENEVVEAVDLYGPLCTPLDRLGKGPRLDSKVAVGDHVAIPNVGAYGATASLVHFLSRCPPQELVLQGDDIVAAYRLCSGHRQEAIVS